MSDRAEFEKWFDGEFDPDKELFAEDKESHWQAWQAARTQGGQGAEGTKTVGSLQSCACRFTAEGGLLKECLYHQTRYKPQPAVPGHLMARIKNLLIALGHQGTVLDDGEPPYDIGEWGIKEAQGLYTLLSTPTTPQADGWIKCSERLPTEADADCDGRVWCWSAVYGVDCVQWYMPSGSDESWKPTGLKRPQPPAQEATK